MNQTLEQFKANTIATNQRWWMHHTCGICEAPVGYVREGEQIYFDSNCECSSYRTQPQPRSWKALFEFVKPVQAPTE